jgi:hypothetical protein
LTTEDVDRALKWYDAPPSLGHCHNDKEPTYVQVPDVGRLGGGEAIYAPDEEIIDLKEFSLSHIDSGFEISNSSNVQASWLMLEGNYISPDNEEDSKPVIEYPQPSNLSPALVQYYSAVTSVILSDTDPDVWVCNSIYI